MQRERIELVREEAPLPLPSTPVARLLDARHETHADALRQLRTQDGPLAEAASVLIATLRMGNKILVAGNGGSAAEAQHFAAELVGRFQRERSPYAVVSLTADTAILTAVANDYGYGNVFARQVMGLGNRGDALVGFSTSGESENLLRAAEAARARGMTVTAITGCYGSSLSRLADVNVRVRAEAAIAQEVHMVITHVLCELIEANLSDITP